MHLTALDIELGIFQCDDRSEMLVNAFYFKDTHNYLK